MDRRTQALAGILLLFAAFQARPHHGPVGSTAFYNTDELIILEGELVEVFWRNPHVRFGLNTVDESGEETFWELETGVPSQLESGGFTADLFPVGSEVKVAGFVSRHRDDFLGLQNMLLPDGREYAGRRRVLLWSTERLEPEDAPRRERPLEADSTPADSLFGVWGMHMLPSEWMAEQDYDHVLSAAGRAAKAAFDPIDHPILDCVPRGMPERMLPSSIELVNGSDRIVMRHFWWGGDRIIHLDRDAPPAETPNSHLGYSIGRWETENTLVVDTTHVNYPYFDRDGTPQSDQVAFEERFTLIPAGGGEPARLGYRLTTTDPVMFDRPLVIDTEFTWSPGASIETSSCELWERSEQGDESA